MILGSPISAIPIGADDAPAGEGAPVATAAPLSGLAILRLTGQATLRTCIVLKPTTATLRLTAQQGASQAPTGLQGRMGALDQRLAIWFNGHPTLCRVAIQIDDQPEIQPEITWENPGTQTPAILRIDHAEIPGDGQKHQIKINVWQQADGRTSPRAILNLYDALPIPPIPQPEWVTATLIRQASATATDLTKIEWQHPGAVKIQAKIGPIGHQKTYASITVGYADAHESVFIADGLCRYCGTSGLELVPVRLGVAGIGSGKFSAARWTDHPLLIRDHAQVVVTEETPDQKAGTATAITGYTNATSLLYDAVAQTIRTALLTQFSQWPAQGDTLIVTTISKLFGKIKEVVRKGGRVTLDDLGRFEARWNTDATVRSVGFTPSAGFKEGTRQGIVMTDAEAKAA